jgi:hypothetical protein
MAMYREMEPKEKLIVVPYFKVLIRTQLDELKKVTDLHHSEQHASKTRFELGTSRIQIMNGMDSQPLKTKLV